MPQLVCPRCQRANPHEAGYCHFDGTPLRLAPGQPTRPPGQLPHEFVFPSGRACRSYDELVHACQEEWADARRLLVQGVFGQFLAGAGRVDLAAAAQKAQAHADPDMGLHIFLTALPATRSEGPRLELKPRRLVLGTLRAGEAKQVRLTVSNSGKGLLHGSISPAEGNSWLRLVGPEVNGEGHCTVKTAREQQVVLHVDTHGLPSGQTFNAKLTVITNGGIVEVPLSMDVGALPFPKPPFQGANNPRALAERMRAQPKPAGPLLESGEVARWFAANGWVYPVPFATARGVAAVQQFFEGMGLSKPPPLQLSEAEAHFICVPPEVAQGQVTLRTPSRKWVYAQVESDVPWLRLQMATVSGPQQTVVAYEVDSSLMDEGRIHQGTLQILANAGQKLALQVTVDVRRPQEPFTRRLLRPFFVGALLALFFRLLLVGPADLYARVLAVPAQAGAPSFDTWLHSPLAQLDLAGPFVKHFVLATWWLGAVIGAVVLWRRGNRWADVLCGIIAGAVAGVLGSATFACLLPWTDAPSRGAWRLLGMVVQPMDLPPTHWIWTPLWVVATVACWALLGGGFGFGLRLAGPRGLRVLSWLGAPVGWAAQVAGMRGIADFFAMS